MIVKDSGDYQLAPAGQHLSVCVDVIDLGNVVVEWNGEKKTQHKCRIVWEIDETMPKNGERYTVRRQFTASLSQKANLRAFLEAWRGQPFTEQELAGFDTENLIGVNAVLQIVHNKKGDRTYDNINAVMKPMKGMAKLTSSPAYLRVKDRPTTGNGAMPRSAQDDHAPPMNDDDWGAGDDPTEDTSVPF